MFAIENAVKIFILVYRDTQKNCYSVVYWGGGGGKYFAVYFNVATLLKT